MSDEHRDKAAQWRRNTAAATRALAEQPDLVVQFQSGAAGLTGNTVRLAEPPRELTPNDSPQMAARYRGSADAIALKAKHHDTVLHSTQVPADPAAREAFETLEQIRCEAVGSRGLLGVTSNLQAVHKHRCEGLAGAALQNTDKLSMADRLAVLARNALRNDAIPSDAGGLLTLCRESLTVDIEQRLRELAPLIDEQSSFANRVREILRDLGLVETPSTVPEQSEAASDAAGGTAQDDDSQGATEETVDPARSDDDPLDDDAVGSLDADSPDDGGDEDPNAAAPQNRRPIHDLNAALDAYQVFTTAFDEVVDASDLCSHEELERRRRQLDQQLVHLQHVIGRLANRLQRRLLAQQARSWDFNLEEGILDTAHLSRVIARPAHHLMYKHEKDTPFRDTVVTLLIDSSGSMRGRSITLAAMSADILARTLERCGVKAEILGFTTVAWKGGKAREQWVRSGKPEAPGRLNDLRHIIYKSADMPWRRARRNLGLMLRDDILKENIDGEALLWAHQRLLARREQRRILVVISDGAPVDDSTLSGNSRDYLECHLHDVVRYIEAVDVVELLAIGIGYDVTRYYPRAVTLLDAEQLGDTLMEQLTAMFSDGTQTQDRRGRFRRGAPRSIARPMQRRH